MYVGYIKAWLVKITYQIYVGVFKNFKYKFYSSQKSVRLLYINVNGGVEILERYFPEYNHYKERKPSLVLKYMWPIKDLITA